MASPAQVLKSIGPKLVPFFKTVAVYFVTFIPSDQPSLFALILKCLPILCLGIFVLLHGMSLANEYTYSRRILLGLCFSCLGDALLIWPSYFELGIVAFALAQMMYISAFGFKPLNSKAGAVVYSMGAFGLMHLMPFLEGILFVAVPLYSAIIFTMVWRAVARVQFYEEFWTWTKLCSGIGAILFACSDAILAFNEFYSPIPYSQALVMTTYYAAQFGIVLSIVNSKASYNKEQEDLKAIKGKTKAVDTNSAEIMHFLTT